MNSSTPTDIYARFGSDSYSVYESKFLDLDVKFADVEGTNMFHVKSFIESYNKVNDEPIVEFYKFLQYVDTPEYLQIVYELARRREKEACSKASKKSKKTGIQSIENLLDETGYYNISKVIVHCYSKKDNTQGYWVCGEVLSRYAQRGNLRFAVMVDMLINAIATFNEEKINEALKCLTLDNEKMTKRIEYFKKGCTKACNYMKEHVGHDYFAYVEWVKRLNAVYVGSMDKKKFMKERAKKNEDGTPARNFIYCKDNKFGVQLRD